LNYITKMNCITLIIYSYCFRFRCSVLSFVLYFLFSSVHAVDCHGVQLDSSWSAILVEESTKRATH
jgi:hypothetical protein